MDDMDGLWLFIVENTIKIWMMTGKYWLVVDLPLWKMMEFVSWEDEIPNIWKVIKAMFQTTNQIYSPSINHD